MDPQGLNRISSSGDWRGGEKVIREVKGKKLRESM